MRDVVRALATHLRRHTLPCEIAQRLAAAAPADALVARLGGHELALLLLGGVTGDDAVARARELLGAVRRPVLSTDWRSRSAGPRARPSRRHTVPTTPPCS